MADNDNNERNNVTNEENDSREEDIVEDTDSDTRYVEETEHEDYDATEKRFSQLEATMDKILGQLSAIREAQGILVENGAVINDTETDIGHKEEDDFVPPSEMDLLI